MRTVARKTEVSLTDRLSLAILFLFLANDILGGAFRYYTVRLGIPWIGYAPNLLIALALVPMFSAYLIRRGITSTYLTVFCLLSASVAFGVFNLGNSAQVCYGIWSLVPFLTGIIILPAFIQKWDRLLKYALSFWAIAVAGVFINYFHTWPWIGFEYQLGTISVSASRLWHIDQFGLFRLPGFSQASYFVAPQIMILALFVRVVAAKPSMWVPVWILSGFAIALTTSKTLALVYLFFTLIWLSRVNVASSLRLFPLTAVVVVVLLPFSMLLVRFDWLSAIHSPLTEGLIATLIERMQVDWPAYIRMITDHGSVIFGRGMGGIGTAQEHFEPWLFSPSDNIAVFAFATFGISGVFLLLNYARKASRYRGESARQIFFLCCTCVVLFVGMTLSVMDSSLLGLVFGGSLRYFQDEQLQSVYNWNVVANAGA